ncbi:retrovirus-related Pol polyprotein from transposon 297 [Trichonephila clavipes]|nr:retrovirus-related Pol polyprotein from transposon 297 [Trichonephila clavipes]
MVQLYRRYEAEKRVGRPRFERLPNVVPVASLTDETDLVSLIRTIVREEVHRLVNQTQESLDSDPQSLEEIVQDEVERVLASVSTKPTETRPRPTYAAVTRKYRAPVQKFPPEPRKTDVWRTADNRPVCFHCGRPGHVMRYCRERKAVFDNSRNRRRNFDDVGTEKEIRRPNFLAVLRQVPREADPQYVVTDPRRHIADPVSRQAVGARTTKESDLPRRMGLLEASQAVIDCGQNELVLEDICRDSTVPDAWNLYATRDYTLKPHSLTRITVSGYQTRGDINTDKSTAAKTNVKHRIFTGDHAPINQRAYRVSPTERRIIHEEGQKMLDEGIVQPSESPWSSPVVLLRKKDGSWRFCVDYRKLNSVTKKDVYPLPRIDDTLDCLKGAKFFSSMDLRSGYWQIEIDEADREKTAFITPEGLYEFKVMPFGLCNAPATFKRMMDNLLRHFKWTMCLCYLDDIIVFSETLEDHLIRLRLVLKCLQEAGLKLNSKKCLFAAQEVKILGHLVSSNGVRPIPTK